MTSAIRKHLTDFVAVIVLIAISAGVSYYILQEQRLRIPFIEEKAYVLNAEFSTGQAVTAGQGQTIRVSGVRIGDIGDVSLKDGRAVIRMDLDRDFKDLVHTDATAMLRPKTGLKDMFIDLDPGTAGAPMAKEGWTIPIAATEPDVNPDEILGALDSDTRDYLKLLVNGAGKGLDGRGGDLRDVFRRFEPTHRDLARVNSQVALRRKNLRRLISNLRVLNTELADHDDELAELVDSSAAVLRSFASEEKSISAAVKELPSTLSTTTDTLGRVQRFAELLGPTAEKLRPAVREIDDANRAVTPFAKEIAPLLRADIRPFVRETRPLVRDLRPAATNLGKAAPNLTQVFLRLNHLFNLAAYNENGREAPDKADRQEGYLFYLAWLNHIGNQLFSTSDAHGTYRPTTAGAPCATIEQIVHEQPELEFLAGLTPILTSSEACGT
jgi:phospholipid/cholesterol/gamma-HCH transport system substrate-binding protein